MGSVGCFGQIENIKRQSLIINANLKIVLQTLGSENHAANLRFAGRPPEGHLIDTDLPHTAVRARLVPRLSSSCNSSGKAIAILGASRPYRLARWHRFVSIERREPLQTALQGTSARAMFCWKIAELTQTCHARPSEPG